MDIRDYVRVLRKGWSIVLAMVLLGVGLAAGLTLATTKVYQADVQIFVAASSSVTASDLAQGQTFTEDRVQSYTSIADDPAVTSAVVKQLKKSAPQIKLTQEELAGKISADAPLNKVLLNLHVTDTDPATAALLANTVAAKFAAVVQGIEQTDSGGKPVVKLTITHPATVPSAPIKPDKVVNIGIGLVLGLLVGVGLVMLRDALDNTVKTASDFDELGVPVLGIVPLDKRTSSAPIAFQGDPHSARSESFRQLRTNLQFVDVDHAPRVIAVTSAVAGEGKTMTAMNLAAALAEAGHRVCLVEADLRRPTIATTLGLSPDVGLTTVLIGHTTAESALQNVGRNLAVLTSGPVPPNPAELLVSTQARAVIDQIASMADYTIIDTAPLLPVADGAEVAAFAEATLVVHRAGKTTRVQAARSIAALHRVGERPVGVVLNMVTRGTGRFDDGYDDYRPRRVHRAGDSAPSADAYLPQRAVQPADEEGDDRRRPVPATRTASESPAHRG